MSETVQIELAHRRAAVRIVAELPKAQADALLILEAAKDFVLQFLADDQEDITSGRPGVVLSLVPALTTPSAAS